MPALENAADDTSPDYYEHIILAQCTPGERCLAFQKGDTRPPLIIRLLPFIPDLLLRKKNYLVALTDKRVMLIQLTNPFNLLAPLEFKKLTASLPFNTLKSMEPTTRALSSSLKIRTREGQCFTICLPQSGAEQFASDVQHVMRSIRER